MSVDSRIAVGTVGRGVFAQTTMQVWRPPAKDQGTEVVANILARRMRRAGRPKKIYPRSTRGMGGVTHLTSQSVPCSLHRVQTTDWDQWDVA